MSSEPRSGIARLEHAATAGVLLLAAGSFVLSYDALHELAVTNHVPRPLAWIWPLIVDGFIITASLAVLHAVLLARASRYPWLLLLMFSATSVVFNVLHAPPTLVARLVAAIPPLTLVLSFELLMRQLRDRLSDAPVHQAMPEPEPATPRPAGHDLLLAHEPTRVRAGRRAGLLSRARELHDAHTREGQRLTGKTLGDTLGISDGYARRLLRQITASDAPA